MIGVPALTLEYMSVPQAAKYLGYTRQRIYQLIDDEVLSDIRLDKTRVVLTSEVEALSRDHVKFKHLSKINPKGK